MKNSIEINEISLDEKEIIEGWRLLKRYRSGHLRAVLKSGRRLIHLKVILTKIIPIKQVIN